MALGDAEADGADGEGGEGLGGSDGAVYRGLSDAQIQAVLLHRLAAATEQAARRLEGIEARLAAMDSAAAVSVARLDERHTRILAAIADLRTAAGAPGVIERFLAGLPPWGRLAIVLLLVAALVGGDDVVRRALDALAGGVVRVEDVHVGGLDAPG